MNSQTVKEESLMFPLFISLSDDRRIAYQLTEGKIKDLPGVVFLGGFRSDMTGSKALALEAFCQNRGQRFLRFDYTGHGQSSGNFIDGTIGGWAKDAIDVIDALAPGGNILVGSSMGGWIMLLVALARPKSVAGLVGIASAPDFTCSLIEEEMNDEQRAEMAKNGVVYVPDCYSDNPFPITRKLIEDGNNQRLLHKPLPISVPVRLLHGTKDEDVPWKTSLKLMESLVSEDVRLTLFKNAGHRLSEPPHLDAICKAVEGIILHN